jgi:hypothetical protein
MAESRENLTIIIEIGGRVAKPESDTLWQAICEEIRIAYLEYVA